MSAHYIVAVAPLPSHLRASVWFSCDLLLVHPSTYITILVPLPSLSACEDHLMVFIGGNKDLSLSIKPRLRFVSVGSFPDKCARDEAAQIKAMANELPNVLDQMLSQSPSANGFLRRPSISFVDTFNHFYIDILHRVAAALKIDTKLLPTLVLWPIPCAAYLHTWSSATSGGSILGIRVRIEKQRKYRALQQLPALDSTDAILAEVFHPEGNLISFAGAPPMYDHERGPQLGSVRLPPASLLSTYHLHAAFVRQAQGVVTLTAYEYEPGAGKAVENAFGGRCIQVGPPFPERWWAGSFDEPAPSPDNLKTKEFLDQALTRFGKRSVLFISFGTTYFPTGRPDQVQLLIRSLLAAEPPMPFIFGMAGAPPALADEISAMLQAEKDSDLSMICGFAPQMFILNHPATGFFLSHGGANSAAESILAEKPMVLWPMIADQPQNAAHLSIDLAVAIELIQVRTGPAVGRPTFRGITPVDSPDALMAEFTETWKRLRGTDGVQMLMNIRALNKAIKDSRRNGMSYKALLSLGNWEETLAC